MTASAAPARLRFNVSVESRPQDVAREDQEKINVFSRLNSRVRELAAQVAAKKRAAEDYEEAGNEVMLLDDETVPYVVGECMVHLPREEVEERLQKCEFCGGAGLG